MSIWERLQHGENVYSYSIRDGYLYHQQAICVAEPLRKKIMDKARASPYAGHRGILTTTQALERYFFWPTLKADIEKYVRECLVCQKVKYDRHKTVELLQPLPVPDQPWESIAMDFIMDLPRTQTGNDAIWTIVDRFSKQAHFIPVRKTIKADHMARVFLAQIFKHHGMPKSIVSDRDPRMTGLFWRALFENLGTKLSFSSAYHPQTDGQNIDEYSFHLVTLGRPTNLAGKIGDWVYLRLMKQKLKQVGRRCPKLSFHSFGPFPIIKEINAVSFQLRLPPSWTMHNVFHVSWLKPYVGPPLEDVTDEQEPEVLDEAQVIEPEQILLYRWKHGSGRRQRQFLSPNSVIEKHMKQFG
ncbi:hypothetical protein L7F22_031980 [Adiantum nelumboides]|nr:hypothetical protein [Adiantum nelumboides]